MSFSIRRIFAAVGLLITALQTVPSLAETILPDANTSLTASPASLTFGIWQIGTLPLAEHSVSITSAGPAKGVAVTGSPGDCGWLSLSGGSGSTPYKASVSVKIGGLVAGNFSC